MATSGRYLYAVRIEGIGNNAAGASNNLYRWCWSRNFFDNPSGADPNNLYKSSLLRWPSELEYSVDFRRGAQALGSMSFDFRRTQDVLTSFWSGKPPRVAKVNGSVGATTSPIVLDTAGLSGTVFIGREAVLLGTETSKSYVVTRGQLETHAHKHDDKVQVWSSIHPTSLIGRVVEVIRVPMGSSGYAEEEVRWTGVLRSIVAAGTTMMRMEADNVISILRNTKIYKNPWRQINGEPLPDQLFASGHAGQRRALVLIDGKHAEVVGYRESGGSADSVGHGYRRRFGGSPPTPPLEELGAFEIREFFSTHPQAPSNSASPAANTLPLQSDPGKLILQLMLTTANGGSPGSNHATYDTGIDQLAGAVPSGLVSVSDFEKWGETQLPLSEFHIGHTANESGQGPTEIELYDLIRELLKARGACLTQTTAGLLSVSSWADAPPYGSANVITQSQIVSVGDAISQDRKLQDVLEEVEIKYDDRVGIGPNTLNGNDVVNQRLTPRGMYEKVVLDARGIDNRAYATILLENYISRYHEPIVEWQIDCLRTADYWPGDVVSLTHDKLWAKGVQGVSDEYALVVGRREKLDDEKHVIRYRLWYVGEVLGAFGYISPSGKVASWDAASGQITLETNNYTQSNDRHITKDADGFFKDDICQLVDQYGTVRDASFLVNNVSGSVITVLGLSVTPVAGDIVRLAAYSSCVSSQKSTWAFISEADGLLDSDPAKEWTT